MPACCEVENAMSVPLSRRSFTLGSVAAALGGSAVFSLPVMQIASAQDATAMAEGDFSSLGLPTLDITVNADSFDGAPTADMAAGRYLVTATIADGLEYGAAAFMSPPAGMSAEDFLTQAGVGGGGAMSGATPSDEDMSAMGTPAAEGEGEEMLPLFVYQALFAGGAGGSGGTTAQAVIDLPSGEWILWGDDPTAAQPPVIFNVTGDLPADVSDPGADLTFTLIDFAISVDGSLSAGDHVIKVQNHGAQPHFLIVMKGPDSMTNDMISDLLMAEMTGATPPAVPFDPEKDLIPVIQTVTQSIGTEQWVTGSLETGTYAAMCFFPTAGEGLPHAYHGMHTVFKVQ